MSIKIVKNNLIFALKKPLNLKTNKLFNVQAS